jgi:hypothetical protein
MASDDVMDLVNAMAGVVAVAEVSVALIGDGDPLTAALMLQNMEAGMRETVDQHWSAEARRTFEAKVAEISRGLREKMPR